MSEEVEKFFKCPFCMEKISMLLDTSVQGLQSYTEDCEVCCNPILISFEAGNGKIRGFTREKAYG